MAGTKEIRTQMHSIKSTQKITSAMEMVAASKMRRAQERMQLGKPYAKRMREVIGHLANANPEYKHTFMQEREIKRVGYILVSNDRGLCGGSNTYLSRAGVRSMKAWSYQGIEIVLWLIGAKGAALFKSFGGNVVAATRDLGEAPSVADLIGSINVMLDA